MAYEEAGVALVADGAAQYLSTLEKIEAAHDALASGVRSVVDAINALDSRLTSAAGEITALAQSSKKADNALTSFGGEAEDAAAAAAAIGDESRAAAKSTDALGDAAGDAGKAAEKFGDSADDAGDGAEGLGKQSRDGAKGLAFLGEAFTGAARRAGEFVVDGLAKVGDALIDLAGAAVDQAGNYESTMNLFQEVTGATTDQLIAAKTEAKALGADLTLPATSAASASDAMNELAKAGFSVDQSMSAAKGTLQLAAAGNLEEAKAAEIASNAINTFGLEAKEATAVADLLAATAAESSVEVMDVAESYKMAGAVFSSFQGPVVGSKDALIDLTTAIGLLGNAGIKGSDAGTSLKQSLLQLAAPSDKAKGLMQELAQSIGESGDIAYDSSGNMRSFKDIVRLTAEATKGMTQEQRQYYVSTIFGADATRSMLVLMQKGADGWDTMREAVQRQNAAADLAAARMKGLKGATQGFQSQLETLALNGIEPLLPLLTEWVSGGAEVVAMLSKGIGPAMQNVAQIITTGQQGIATLGEVAASIGVPAISGFATATAAYAVVLTLQAIPAITASVPAILAQAAAMGTAAAATAAALAPYALIALAIGGVVKAYQDLDAKIQGATMALLESHADWNRSIEVLNLYNQSSDQTKHILEDRAHALDVLREQEIAEVERLGHLKIAGSLTAEQEQKLKDSINARGDAIRSATVDLERNIQLYEGGDSRRESIEAMTQAHQDLSGAVGQNTQDFAKLSEELDKISQEGREALGDLATTHASFISDMESRQRTHEDVMTGLLKERAEARTADQQRAVDERIAIEQKGYQQSLADAARAYAEQSAAQRAALGEQLLAYIENQRQMGRISDEQASQLRDTTIKHFGVTRDSAAALFGDMTTTVDKFASGAITDAADVAAAWGNTEDAAVKLREKAEALKQKYVMELIAEIDKPGANIDEIRKKLSEVPGRVETELTDDGSIAIEQRAIEEFHRHLDNIPRTIHVNVDVDIPDVVTPHSPTPFEIGLWGIRDAMAAVGDIAKLTGDKLKEAFAGVAESFSWAAAIPRAQEDMDAFIRSLTSQEGVDLNFLLAGGGGALDRLGGSAMKDFTQALADAEKLRGLGPEGAAKADEFLQERIDQIKELADLQRQLLLATDDTKRKEIETSIERISSAQMNELMALLASIPGIEEFLKQIEGRASGGSVISDRAYWVGERGRRELFVPGQSGSIFPEDKIMRAVASMAQMAAMGGQQTVHNYYGQVGHSVQMPVYTNNTPSAIQQSAEIAWSMLP